MIKSKIDYMEWNNLDPEWPVMNVVLVIFLMQFITPNSQMCAYNEQ